MEEFQNFEMSPSDIERRMAEIDKALELNRLEMEKVEKSLASINQRKIFTLKELKKMEEEEKQRQREQLEEEKRLIDITTAEALEKASKIRSDSLNFPEDLKKESETEALQLELDAIAHDLKIRKIIISESEALIEEALADIAIEENLFSKYKKASFTCGKKDDSYFEIKNKIYKSKNNKEKAYARYKSLKEKIDGNRNKLLKFEKLFRTTTELLGTKTF